MFTTETIDMSEIKLSLFDIRNSANNYCKRGKDPPKFALVQILLFWLPNFQNQESVFQV